MKTVLIKHDRSTNYTHIEIDGVRQQRVRSYKLDQIPGARPVFTLVQDGDLNRDTGTFAEITTSFTPTTIDFISK